MDDLLKQLKKENVELDKCIEDTLFLLVDYDGYTTAEGLKKCIDDAVRILNSKKPEKIVNVLNEECCPVCFRNFIAPTKMPLTEEDENRLLRKTLQDIADSDQCCQQCKKITDIADRLIYPDYKENKND